MIMSKKKFIDWLDKQLNEEEVILITQDLTGELSYSKKRNEKKVSFGFAADAFKDKDTVGDFLYNDTPLFSVAVCKKTHVSEETLELYNKEN